MNSKKEIGRSASTQSDSIRSEKSRNPSKRRKEATEEFKNFYVKNLKVRISSPNSQPADQTSFEDLFTFMNQACTFLPSQFSPEDKQNSSITVNFQRLSPCQAIKQLTKKLAASKERYSDLTNQVNEKQQFLTEAKAQIAELKVANNDLRSRITELREQIVFWRQGHEKMLQEAQDLKANDNKQNLDANRYNKLKQLKNSIKEERKNQKTKMKMVKPVQGVVGLLSRGFARSKDLGIQTENRSMRVNFENLPLCESYEDSNFQGIIIQANNQLREDLRFAEDYISKLKIKVDCLEKKLKQERDMFKIEKEREFALLKQKFSTFLKDYHKFRLTYNELKAENAVLKKTVPQDDLFRLSLTPNKLI